MKRALSILSAALALALGACGGGEPYAPMSMSNQCLRAPLFQACLTTVPKGPEVTHDNPWHKVVDECDSAARAMSWRMTSQIPLECRSQ